MVSLTVEPKKIADQDDIDEPCNGLHDPARSLAAAPSLPIFITLPICRHLVILGLSKSLLARCAPPSPLTLLLLLLLKRSGSGPS